MFISYVKTLRMKILITIGDAIVYMRKENTFEQVN